jgi:hypothetical protein
MTPPDAHRCQKAWTLLATKDQARCMPSFRSLAMVLGDQMLPPYQNQDSMKMMHPAMNQNSV